MAYENSAGLGVHNQFGPRVSGGEQGVVLTDGVRNEYLINLPLAGLTQPFPVGNGTKYITGVDKTFVTGTVTHIAIGGVAVYDSTTPVTLPVNLPAGNTGTVVVTGGTGGTFILEFKNVAP